SLHRRSWVKVKFVARKIKEGFRLIVEIAGKVVDFVAKTVQHVANFIELILRKVAELARKAVKAAIDWLKEALGWDHILNTKRVLFHVIDQTLDRIGGSADHFRNLIGKHFDKAEQGFVKSYSDFRANLQKLVGTDSPAFTDIARKIQQPIDPRIGDFLKADAAKRTVSAQQVRNNGLANAFKTHGAAVQKALFQALEDHEEKSAVLQLLRTFQRIVGEFEKPIKTFLETIQKIYAEPHRVFELGIFGFFDAFRDLVVAILRATKTIVLELIKLVATLIRVFRKTLTTAIEIPIISQLYRELNEGQSPSLLDMICLVVAAPMTIMYRTFAFGGRDSRGKARPPFTREQVLGGGGYTGIVNMQLPWPHFLMPEGMEALAPAPNREWLKYSWSIFAGLNTFAGMIINTVIDTRGKAMVNTPVDPQPDPATVVVGFLSLIQASAGWVLGAPYDKYMKRDAVSVMQVIDHAAGLAPIVLDAVLMNSYMRGRAKQDGFAGIWGSAGMSLARTGLTTLPAIILEGVSGKPDILSMVQSMCGALRGLSGFYSQKWDLKGIAFGIGQAIALLGEAGEGALQIYNGLKPSKAEEGEEELEPGAVDMLMMDPETA
ncbi:MAG: hypothetical protein AAF570_03605, partial [Bacteroidota bacterium]